MTQISYRLTQSRDGWAVNVPIGDGRAFVAGYIGSEWHATKFDQFDRELDGRKFWTAQTLNGHVLTSEIDGLASHLFLTRADAAQAIANVWQTTRAEVLAARDARRTAQS